MGRMAAALAIALICGMAVAADRRVVVNGILLDREQLEQLDALAGAPVPNGAYWLDTERGIWGYADDPTPRGVLGGFGQGGTYSLPGTVHRSPGSGDGDETDWSGFRVSE